MLTCDNPTCTGHLGKFDSCRDEALYTLSFDLFNSPDDTTGESEFRGWFARILVDSPESVDLDSGPYVVAPGRYLLCVANSGGVTVVEYETDREINDAFHDEEAAYSEYLGQEDNED